MLPNAALLSCFTCHQAGLFRGLHVPCYFELLLELLKCKSADFMHLQHAVCCCNGRLQRAQPFAWKYIYVAACFLCHNVSIESDFASLPQLVFLPGTDAKIGRAASGCSTDIL